MRDVIRASECVSNELTFYIRTLRWTVDIVYGGKFTGPNRRRTKNRDNECTGTTNHVNGICMMQTAALFFSHRLGPADSYNNYQQPRLISRLLSVTQFPHGAVSYLCKSSKFAAGPVKSTRAPHLDNPHAIDLYRDYFVVVLLPCKDEQ